MHNRHRVLFAAALAFAPAPVWAAGKSLDALTLDARDRYQSCIALVSQNAQDAYIQSLAWHNSGGGAAADHCSALALVQLKRYREAALKLDAIAATGKIGDAAMRAALYDQAGNVWLLSGQAQNAEQSLTSALALSARDNDILADRARARAMRKDWVGADADLSVALARDANRADLFVLRASARHAEGKTGEALADVDRALGVYPNYPDALVERGAIRLANGDAKGARADWQRVIAAAPNSEAARAARKYIGEMDTPLPAPH